MPNPQTRSDATVTSIQKVNDSAGQERAPADQEPRQGRDGAFDVSIADNALLLDAEGKSILDIAWKGGNGDYTLVIEASPDETNWYSSSETISSAEGNLTLNTGFRYVRVRVDSTGTGDLDISMGAS